MADCMALLRSLDFYAAITCPYTNAIGNWVFAIIIGVVLVAIYIKTEDIAIPAILGLLYGLVGVALIPPEFRTFYYIIIALSISGIIYRLAKKDTP